jgi:hypothetical protein
MAIITVFVTPKSPASCLVAGATMEEEIGLMNVNKDTTRLAAHFCLYDQLIF